MKKNFIIILPIFLLLFALLIYPLNKKPIEVEKMSYALDDIIEYSDEDLKLKEVSGTIEDDKVTISVIGSAKDSITPDIAVVSGYIEKLDSEMTISKESCFNSFEKIVDLLKENDISEDDIKLNYFNCQPNYDYSNLKAINGYFSRLSYSFEVKDLTKLKTYIDILVENGTNVSDICYKISDINTVYTNLLSQAVENAVEKAGNILDSSSLNVIRISEESIYSSNSLYSNFSDDLSLEKYVGKVEINAKVIVEIESQQRTNIDKQIKNI